MLGYWIEGCVEVKSSGWIPTHRNNGNNGLGAPSTARLCRHEGGFQWKTDIKDTLGRLRQEIWTLLNGLHPKKARSKLQDQAQQYLYTLQEIGTKWRHPRINDIPFKASNFHKHSNHASHAVCSCFEGNLPDQICEEDSEAITPSIYIGPVASANTVMKSGQHRDEIVRKEKVIGSGMKGAGIWDNIPFIIIKGLWQSYAAATEPYPNGIRNICELEDMLPVPDGAKKLAITVLGGVGKTQIVVEQAYMATAEVVEIHNAKLLQMKEHFKNYLSEKDKRNVKELIEDLASSNVIHVCGLNKRTEFEFLEKSLHKNLLHDPHAAITLLKQLIFLPLAITQEQETDVVELLSKDFGNDQLYKDLQNQVQTVDNGCSWASQHIFFITIQPANGYLNIHRLREIIEIFPNHDHMQRQLWRECMPHAHSLSKVKEFQDIKRSINGRYNEAEELEVQVLDICKRNGQPYANLRISGTMAGGRRARGTGPEEQVLEIRQRVLGPEHPDTLTSMAHLSRTYADQGQYKEEKG
ncbi:hypothetical protein BDW72DRAFT_207287 [Aspergillus terricola var. indicus]